MKKVIFIYLLILGLFFNSGLLLASSFTDHFTINCTINGKKSGKLYLFRYDADNINNIKDSAQIVNGQCYFKGLIAEPCYAVLSDGDMLNRNNPNIVSFFIDASDMKVQLEWNDFKNIRITGSPLNDIVQKYNDLKKPLLDKKNNLFLTSKSFTDSLTKLRIDSEIELMMKEEEELNHNFIMTNNDSYYSAYLLNINKTSLPYNKLLEYYNVLSDSVKHSKWATNVKKDIDLMNSLQAGNCAPFFSSVDINGEKLSLSDFKGKYVLIDFWASWCVPCRKGNPHLKELYKKYNNKGFEIICIADDDSNPDKWKAAVEKDSIEMFHHILRGLKICPNHQFDRSNDISDKFAVHYLPTKYLIDKEGKIIGVFDNNQLDKKLEEIFGY